MMLRWLLCLCVCAGCYGSHAEVHARDVRIALLVGHQHGWKKDPFLEYAISGDLLPMARVLQRSGFEVQVLQNPSASQVRQALKQVQHRARQAPRATTFLFYYSGHADRKALHLGPRTPRPLTYKELVTYFRQLPIRRRIAVLDACFSGEIVRHFGSMDSYRQLVRKGARGIRPLDLTKAFPNQGDQSGLQILTSSLDYAWESKRHKASVFTYYLLKGLAGHADRDRDGKISVSELFNYASDAMAREIRQKPLLLGMIQRSRTYALAPAYHSRLLIGPRIVGKIRVSVANFFWSRQKKGRHPMRLAVVHGAGQVEVEHKGVCRRQSIFLPKGKEAHLHNRWQQIVCQQLARTRKGAIELPAELYVAPPLSRDWSLSWSGGALGASALGAGVFGGAEMALWHRYFGILLGGWGTSLALGGLPRSQLLLGLRVAGGYHWRWRRFELFTGAYLGALVLIQDLNVQPNAGLLWQIGALLKPILWLTPRWGLELGLDANLILGRFAGEIRPQLGYAATLGLRFLL